MPLCRQGRSWGFEGAGRPRGGILGQLWMSLCRQGRSWGLEGAGNCSLWRCVCRCHLRDGIPWDGASRPCLTACSFRQGSEAESTTQDAPALPYFLFLYHVRNFHRSGLFFPWILYFLQPVKRTVGLKTTSLHPQTSFTLPLIFSQIIDAEGVSAAHLSLFLGIDCLSLAFPGWRPSRSGLLPCRDDGAGRGSSQNPGKKTSSGKQPVCASGAVPCRGQGEPSSGRILLFPERYSSRDDGEGRGARLVASQLCDGSLKALIKALNPPPSLRPGGNKGRWKGLERARLCPPCFGWHRCPQGAPDTPQRGSARGPWVVSSCPQGASSSAGMPGGSFSAERGGFGGSGGDAVPGHRGRAGLPRAGQRRR